MTALADWIAAQRALVEKAQGVEQAHFYGEALMPRAKAGASHPTALRLVEVLMEAVRASGLAEQVYGGHAMLRFDYKGNADSALAECERIVKEANGE